MKDESLPECAFCDQPATLASTDGSGLFTCEQHRHSLIDLTTFGPIPDLSFSWRLSFR